MLEGASIAVTGAAGACGQVLRTALAGHDVPFANLRLLDRLTEEAIISEYAGEPTLVAALEPEALADRDVIFLCGSAEESNECLRWKRRPGAIVIDLSGAAASNQEIPLVALTVNPDLLGSFPRIVAAPHPIAYALSSVLAPIERAAGVERLAAVVLRPVSDFGEAGIEELHKQTISLLNFSEIPKEVFDRQMAFNLLPQTAVRGSGEEPTLESRLALEIDRILGGGSRRTTLRLVVAPVFHGHEALAHVRMRDEIPIARLRQSLANGSGLALREASRQSPTPVECADGEERLVVDVTPDGLDGRGVWVSFVGARLREEGADNAVEIAVKLLSS